MPTVELFGPLRIRAGLGAVAVHARTAGAALAEVETQLPCLTGCLLEDSRLSRAYRLCLNGTRFLDDLDWPLATDDALLVIAADPGG